MKILERVVVLLNLFEFSDFLCVILLAPDFVDILVFASRPEPNSLDTLLTLSSGEIRRGSETFLLTHFIKEMVSRRLDNVTLNRLVWDLDVHLYL